MKLGRTVLTIAAVVGLLSTSVGAGAVGFVNNRTQWLALSPEARIGYVQALNDSLNFTFVDDTLTEALAKKGRTECLKARQMTALRLSELITVAYDNERLQNLAPSAIYIMKMADICNDYINRARLEFGLGPQ
jgi:hypothetical protein